MVILGLQAFAFAFDFSTQVLSTLSALCVAFIGLLVLYQVCKPFDWKRGVLWSSVTAAMLVCVTGKELKDIFSLTALDLQQTLVLGVFLLLCWPTMGAILTVFEKARRILLKAEKPHGRGEKD